VIEQDGIYGAGVASRPMDVKQSNEEATGALIRVLQKIVEAREKA
jgi:heterodisulfide reductase subunit A-like polyferredoxin